MDVSLDDFRGETMLMLAIEQGNVAATRYILDKGADPNHTDGYGNPAMNYAIKHAKDNSVEIMELLLDRGAEIYGVSSHYKPLSDAIAMDKMEQFQFVLKTMAEDDPKTGQPRCPEDTRRFLIDRAFMTAVVMGRTDFARILIEDWDASPESLTPDKQHPLLTAVEKGHADMVALLCEKGANVDRIGSYQQSPLMKACIRGDQKMAEALIERGCNPDLRDKEGRTARDLARRHGYFTLDEYLEQAIYPEHNGFRKVAEDTVMCSSRDMNGNSLTHVFNFTLQTMTTTFEDGEHAPAIETKPFREVSCKAVQEAQQALKKMQRKP